MAEGLFVSPLSQYHLEPGRPGLHLGYAAIPEAELVRGVGVLAGVLRRILSDTSRALSALRVS